MDLSIIIPLFNEQDSLRELSQRIYDTLKDADLNYEIFFIDDGSSDNSLMILREIHKKYSGIKILSFRRNYGKSAALSEGFKLAAGEIIITMDADLQDDPAEIPNLLQRINEGYDLLKGKKVGGGKRGFKPKSDVLLLANLSGIILGNRSCDIC